MPATKKKMDFTNVREQSAFRKRRQPEGDYVATIKSVEDGESNAGNSQWIFTVTIEEDPRASYPIYAGHDEKQAWKIRKLFIACGIDVPKRLVNVDPNKLVGKTFGATLEDDEYEGREQSNITDFVPLDEMMPPGDEDDDTTEDEVYERPARKTAKKTAPVVEEDDEDEEYEDDDEPEPEPAPRKRAAKKAPARRAPEPEDDEDEDEDDEPEPAPRRTAKKTAPAKKAAARRRPAPVEDDEDEDLDLDDL